MNGRAILRLAVSTALWLGTLAGVAVEPAVGPTVATLPPGLVWPESWLVYTDLQEADADLGALREAPAAIQGVAGRQVQPVKGRLSLLRPGEAATEKRAALVFGVVRSDRDRVVEMGCAADWWMEFRLNGKTLCDTTRTGEVRNAADRILRLPLKQGDNLLAFKVLSGKRGWSLALLPPGELPARPESRTGPGVVILSTDFHDAEVKTYANDQPIGAEPGISQLTSRANYAVCNVKVTETDGRRGLEFFSDGSTTLTHATHGVAKIIPNEIAEQDALGLNGSVAFSVLPSPAGAVRGNVGIVLYSTALSLLNAPATISFVHITPSFIGKYNLLPRKNYRIDFAVDFRDGTQHAWEYLLYEEGVKEPLFQSGPLKTRDPQGRPALFAVTAAGTPYLRVHGVTLSVAAAKADEPINAKAKPSAPKRGSGLAGLGE